MARKSVKQAVYNYIVQGILGGSYVAGEVLPSVRQLAGDFGVSINPVQRAMEMLVQEGIVQAIWGKGYRVIRKPVMNEVASSGRNGCYHVAFVYPFATDQAEDVDGFYFNMICEAEQLCTQAGHSLILKNSLHNPQKEREIIDSLLEQQVDGVLLYPCLDNPNFAHYQSNSNATDLVYLDRIPETGNAVDYVTADSEGKTAELVAWLVSQGASRIAYVRPATESSVFSERFAGYERGLRQAGLALDKELVVTTDFLRTRKVDIISKLEGLLAIPRPIDAIIFPFGPVIDPVLERFKDRGVTKMAVAVEGGYWRKEPAYPTVMTMEQSLVGDGMKALLRKISATKQGRRSKRVMIRKTQSIVRVGEKYIAEGGKDSVLPRKLVQI